MCLARAFLVDSSRDTMTRVGRRCAHQVGELGAVEVRRVARVLRFPGRRRHQRARTVRAVAADVVQQPNQASLCSEQRQRAQSSFGNGQQRELNPPHTHTRLLHATHPLFTHVIERSWARKCGRTPPTNNESLV